MVASPNVSRIIVVVLDGLRADAIPLFALPTLTRLARNGASTLAASTVSPSVTAAAMGSLFTGVLPVDHGRTGDRFRAPRPRIPLQPLPRIMRDAGIPTFAFLARLPLLYRPLAARLAGIAGVQEARFSGNNAHEIVAAARDTLSHQRRGLFVFHWPDGDRAGHAHGWTSRPYSRAIMQMDEALGALDALTGASGDRETLLVAMADHGGGGARLRDHDSTHKHDRTIPMILSGGTVVTGELAPQSSLLDVPATIAWAMGVTVPAGYAGRPLTEAFASSGTTRQRDASASKVRSRMIAAR